MVLVAVLISYFLGSIPTAYILGRVLKGIDIRKFGSGNVGATNAFRVLGKTSGVIVLLLDILKGIISVTWLGDYFSQNLNFSSTLLRIVLGIACICGHNWTIFLGFKGGKGVATTLGVLAGLGVVIKEIRLILFFVILVWLISFLFFRMVSLASILSALCLPIFTVILARNRVLVVFSLFLAIFIIFRHRLNIKRILQGKESQFK